MYEKAEQSFLKALFYNVIPEDMIFPYPMMEGDDRENTSLILDSTRKFFSSNVDSKQIDIDHMIPEKVLTGLKELGLFGLQIPTEFGGIGLSTLAFSRVMQEIASLDASIAVTCGAHQAIGLKSIQLFGTDEQKKRYLPKLATGEWVAAFALTEPGTGSDATAISTKARMSKDGTHYVLNGSKIWITNGGFADIFTVFATTSQEGKKPQMSAFIVERNMGVKNGPNERKLGICGASTTELFFDSVRVPKSNLLGEEGKGFKVAMEVLNSGRLGLAAGCVGECGKLLHLAIHRVQERRAFGRNIGEFGLIKDKIANMMAQTFALESVTYLTAGMVDAKVQDFSLESAVCKIFGSETLWNVANETLQIAAGIGYMSDYPYERMMRDARINLIFEGTNEILRCFIALAGMAGPGKEMLNVSKAIREPIKKIGLLGDFAIRKARNFLSRERLSKAHPLLNRETVIFEEFTDELATYTQSVLRKHGSDISEMQLTQKRIADMVIDLYAMAACLARTTRAIEKYGEDGARRQIDLTALFTNMAQKRLKQIVSDFQRNDDELRKVVASRAYLDGTYPFDIV